jgi:hypothetical protein
MMIFISSGDAPRRRGEGATNVELNYRDSKRVVSWFGYWFDEVGGVAL